MPAVPVLQQQKTNEVPAEKQESLQLMEGQIGSSPVLQAIWIGLSSSESYKWHTSENGLLWHLEKDTGMLWYSLDEVSDNPYIAENEGPEKGRPLEGWLADREMWTARPDDRRRMDPLPEPSEPKPEHVIPGKTRAALIEAMRALPKIEEVGLIGKIIGISTEIAETLTKEFRTINLQCVPFAKRFQGALQKTGVAFIPINLRIEPDRKRQMGTEPSISLNEPRHSFDNVVIGVEEHYATMLNTTEGKIVIDNHHPTGIPLDAFLASLQFDIRRHIRDEEYAMLNQQEIMRSGKIQVLLATPEEYERVSTRPKEKAAVPKGYVQDVAREAGRE